MSLFQRDRRTIREERRDRLVAGLRVPGCPDCGAAPGDWCDPMHFPATEFVRIDRNPPRVVHSSRIVASVAGGHVSRPLLIAQFDGGELPVGLTTARR